MLLLDMEENIENRGPGDMFCDDVSTHCTARGVDSQDPSVALLYLGGPPPSLYVCYFLGAKSKVVYIIHTHTHMFIRWRLSLFSIWAERAKEVQ